MKKRIISLSKRRNAPKSSEGDIENADKGDENANENEIGSDSEGALNEDENGNESMDDRKPQPL